MSEKQNDNYWNLVPANVLTDTNLTANAKLLYGDIFGLTKSKGHCWAANKYFADKYRVHRNTISRWLKELAANGYITNVIHQGPNGYERKIFLTGKASLNTSYPSTGDSETKNEYTPQRKEGGPINDISGPPNQNDEHNSTANNKLNNTANSTTKQQELARSAHHSIAKKQTTGNPNAAAIARNKNGSNRSELISIECYCGHVFAVPRNWINDYDGVITCSNVDCKDPVTGKPYKIPLSLLRQCKENPPGVIILKEQINLP